MARPPVFPDRWVVALVVLTLLGVAGVLCWAVSFDGALRPSTRGESQ
jgi:hypothetical protein